MSEISRAAIVPIAHPSGRCERWRAFTGLGAALCLILCAPPLAAQQSASPRIAFNGFGTLGLATSSESEADYIANITQAKGPGHSERLSLTLDSRIAGQVFARVTNEFTAVVQVVAEQNANHPFAPTLEWANLRYAVTPNMNLRAGRIVAPVFLVSEYRKVSFVSAWERPPVEVYSLMPTSTWDGVDVTYQRALAGWTTSVNLLYGRTELEVPAGHYVAERAWGANGTVHRGAFTGRAAVFQANMRADILDPLMQGLHSLGSAGAAVADRYTVNDRGVSFSSTGVEYDRGRWFTLAEFARFSSHTAAGTKGAGYVHAGLRWRSLTPFATYARAVLFSPDSVAGVDLTALPPELVPAGAALNGGLNAALRSAPSQQSLAIGLRWDVRAGLAMKAQLDGIDLQKRSAGTFTNLQPRFQPGSRAYLVSVSTVFVF